MIYLGLDLGTSGLKGVLVAGDGRILGSAARPYPVSTPAPGWSEQDPADWIAALEQVVADLRAAHPEFASLRAIAVSGQMHGATLLDRDGQVLRPCILWNDTRAHAQAAALDGQAPFRAISGNVVFPGFTAPKLVWLRDTDPAMFARVTQVLLPAAFLNRYLTGEAVGDHSDASGTGWLDTGMRAWSPDLLSLGAMRPAQMPRLVAGSAPAGQVRADLARAWGLRGPVIVAGGAGDNAAAALGLGLVANGAGAVSLGTSGVVMALRDRYSPAPETAVHTFCHALDGQWLQMGVMLAATDALNWLARLTGHGAAQLVAELGPTLRAPGAVRFQPYLSGERTPHNTPHLRAGFAGIGAATDRAALTQAVLEGVSFGLRDCLGALQDAGAAPQALIATGGGARSEYWLALLASVLNLPLLCPEGAAEGAALGAARLAMLADRGAPADVLRPPAGLHPILPDPALVDAFAAAHARFRADAQAQLATGAA